MTSTTTEQVSPKTLRRVIVAAGIGNFVEWFDFAVYGFLATTIAQQFFPSGDASAALLKTFAVFAVAFAFRPLGGIFFGMLGDRIGRKRTLAMTILLMAECDHPDRPAAHLCRDRGGGADSAVADPLRPGLFRRRRIRRCLCLSDGARTEG